MTGDKLLNVHQLGREGADIQTKVEELEQLNQSIRQRDKIEDDAIAHLSDQLIAITGRLQELEKTNNSIDALHTKNKIMSV